MGMGVDLVKRLFDYLKECLGTDYTVSFQTIHEDQPDQLGVFFYQGIEDDQFLDGSDRYECYNVHLQLQTQPSEDEIFRGMDYLREMVDFFEQEAEGNDLVDIVNITRKGARVSPLGNNEHGYPVLVSNLQVLYLLTSDDEDSSNTPTEDEESFG